MLHILWLILKFILILLGIVLGLILLAVLLLLFCPVRYRAFVAKEESGWKEIRGSGSVSWLFRGVSLKADCILSVWNPGKPDSGKAQRKKCSKSSGDRKERKNSKSCKKNESGKNSENGA